MEELIVRTQGAVRILELNRPDKRNALNDALVAHLKSALAEAGADTALRAVLIVGSGKDFCSGADLATLQKIADASREENVEDARSLAELFSMIRCVRIPVVAAVHGRALAGGCGLATACDLIVASRSARFGYPEVKIGFVPAIVTAFLRRNISEKRAFEMLTQGFEFSAERAYKVGLVNVLIDDSTDLEEGALQYISVYDKVSRSAVEMTKALLYGIDGMNFEQAAAAGVEVNADARMTPDCKSGIARFLEK